MSKVRTVLLCSAIFVALTASAASAGIRTVGPGDTFRLSNRALIDEVRIKDGPALRMRCVGDGCDWRRKGKDKILASISELDRIFRSHAPVPLTVATVRE